MPHAAMNSSVSEIRAARPLYCSPAGDPAMKPSIQRWTLCRSAYPPDAKARSRLSVAADCAVASSRRFGSGVRASTVNSLAVDVVAAIGRQRDAVARLEIVGARLGELAGDAADLHDRHAGRIGQHDRHLQQDAEHVADIVGVEFGEALRAIAALQQESLAFARPGPDRPSDCAPRRRTPAGDASSAWLRQPPAPPDPGRPGPDGSAWNASFAGTRLGPRGPPTFGLWIYGKAARFASRGCAAGERSL